MPDNLVTKIKVFIPGYNFYPLELSLKWMKNYYNRGLQKYNFIMPPSSVGFGWIGNIFKLFKHGK
jgi:hypothetical protein